MSEGTAAALEAQLRSARLRSCEVEPGITLRYELPGAFRVQRIVDAMRAGDGEAAAELLAPLLREWLGVTQATLLGAGVGSDKAAPVSAELFRLAAADRPAWVSALGMHAVEQATQHAASLQAARGN